MPTGVRRLLLRVCVTGLALAVALLVAGSVFILTLPSVGDAQERVRRVLASHHGRVGRLPIPRKLRDAVVAVEDEHFYTPFVLEILDGAGRAAVAALHTNRDPGGSTIPQQLAKLLYGHGTDLGATLQEIGLGVKLSLAYSKAQILSMYLNAAYFGNGFWGYEAAARGYFHTAPRHLDWAEAAMLAGLPQAPSAYDPLLHLALARDRQRHVLDQLVANHFLTPAHAAAAFRTKLPLR